MYPITSAVKALFDSESRQVLRITGTDKNGVAINITDANVVLGSFNIDRYSCNGNRLEVGTAIAAEMTVKLDNHDGTYNGIVFEGTELFVEIGIGDPVNWMPCGFFTPDEQPRTANQITIHALDRMVTLDNSVPGLVPWTTETGESMTDGANHPIYFMTDLVTYPATIQTIIRTICGYYNIPFTQDISSLPNYNYTISEALSLQQPTTYRNIIQWCAGVMGTCAWIDWTGSLRFSWYGAETGYASTPANRFSSDLSEDDVEITGVQYTNLENYTVLAGLPEYTIDMTGNYLMAGSVTQILTTVNNRLNGYTYRPFSATIINAPYLWPMDSITFTDKDGNDHTCILTNVNFGINGAMSIEGKGESMQAASRDTLSGMTKEQGVLVEQAREATQQLNDSLTQEEIFNRLTDNGAEQGLILYNGKIYLNAEYIQASTIVANLLMAGILTIGGQLNGDGGLIVKDASGNIIGTWDKNGITATNGTFSGTLDGATGTFDGEMSASGIKGGTLTLGGANNVNGSLSVINAGGNVIGTWDNNGINIKSGQFAIEGPITAGAIRYGLYVNEWGSLAIGPTPDNPSEFDGNKCGFQVDSVLGYTKLSRVFFHSEDANGIYSERMHLRSGNDATYGDFVRFLHYDGDYTNSSILVIGNELLESGVPFRSFDVDASRLKVAQIYPRNNNPLYIYYPDLTTRAIDIDDYAISLYTPSGNYVYIHDNGVRVSGEDLYISTSDGNGGNLGVDGNVSIGGDLSIDGNVSGIAEDLQFASQSSTNMNVLARYVKLGRLVTVAVEVQLLGASAAELSDFAYGFPAPLQPCTFMVSVNSTPALNVMKCATLDTSGYMSLIGSYNNTSDKIYITGSYISAS